MRTPIGWAINGPISATRADKTGISNLIATEASLYDMDDDHALSPIRAKSVNDQLVLDVWDNSVDVVDGHYQLDIPFKKANPMLPNNKIVAERRLKYLRRRMDKDADFAARYKAGMQAYLDDGYAEAVPDDDTEVEGMTWYIPHHAVFSPKKPDKLRIVFDCAAEYKGTSINKAVHQGPDLTNRLIGVLLRFREKPIAMIADVQAMYH